MFPTIFSPVPFQHFPLLIWREKSHRKSVGEKARERARWPRTVNFCYYVNFVQFSSLFSPEISQEWKENWIYTLDFSSLWCSLISMMVFLLRRRPDTTQKIRSTCEWNIDMVRCRLALFLFSSSFLIFILLLISHSQVDMTVSYRSFQNLHVLYTS